MSVHKLEANLERSQQITLHHCPWLDLLSSEEARVVAVSELSLADSEPSCSGGLGPHIANRERCDHILPSCGKILAHHPSVLIFLAFKDHVSPFSAHVNLLLIYVDMRSHRCHEGRDRVVADSQGSKIVEIVRDRVTFGRT